MSLSELLGGMLGWLAEFIEFVVSFVPHIEIIQFNERGVRYVRGKRPTEVKPGVWWYWPWCTQIEKHNISRDVLVVESLPLETNDIPARRVEVGMVLTYHIVDVVQYEAENIDADESMAEAAEGAMQDIITTCLWEDLNGDTSEGTRLGGKLARRMGKALEKFGVEVESCRPTEQITLDSVSRHFGVRMEVAVKNSDD